MNKIRAVIWREFIERVRTRAFVLSTLLFPVLMIVWAKWDVSGWPVAK